MMTNKGNKNIHKNVCHNRSEDLMKVVFLINKIQVYQFGKIVLAKVENSFLCHIFNSNKFHPVPLIIYLIHSSHSSTSAYKRNLL